jgi:uncharacterized membrane protein
MNLTIILLSLGGLFLAFYAVYVRNKKIDFPDYKPILDINNKISCTKAFTGEYSTVLYFPNTLYFLVCFGLCFLYSFSRVNYIFYITVPAIVFMLYLAYLSYFKQKNFCIVSFLMLIIMVLLAILSYIQELL